MKLWYSIYDETIYKGDENSFYQSTDFEWAKTILNNKEIIIQEFYEVLKSNSLFDPYFNQMLTSKQGSWKTIGLKFWTINNYKNQKFFPKTISILNSIPELVSASFNKLEAGGEVQGHCGDTNGIFRCHLGIEIPSGLPQCGFEVNQQQQAWQNGELLIFCDAHFHRAFNYSEGDRYIFLFDIIRKEAIPQKSNVVSTVLSSLALQKIALLIGYRKLEKIKRNKLKPLVFILKPIAKLAVWFVNTFKIY